MTAFSVVICTYNRRDRVPRAIRSVLGQTFEDFDLVVVDDGSVDDTADVVAAIDDPRLRYVRLGNSGLSAARNAGVALSSGRYVTFLDDDDEALPGWLEQFQAALRNEDAVATCAAYAVDTVGRVVDTRFLRPLGSAYEGYRGQFLSGTFALPRSAYEEIGGFADGLECSHHAEFALRLLPYCRSQGWPVRPIEEPLLRIETRPYDRRPENTPAKILSASNYLLAHHTAQLARSPEALANCHARAGVAAARLGRYGEARYHFRRAARTQPRSARHWLRYCLALAPPLGDAVWRVRRYRGVNAPNARV